MKSKERKKCLPHSVPDVTDLSGMSRAVLPPPARAAAFELLLAVMFIAEPATHLMDKHTQHHLHNLVCNLDSYSGFFLHFYL